MPPATRRAAQILYHCTALSCKRLVNGLERTDKQNGKDFGSIFDRPTSCRQRDGGTKPRSPEHQQLCNKGSELQEKLAEKLNDEEKEMLTELVDTLFEESCCDEQRKFERGFRLGVLITAEIFTEQDIFF